MRGSGEMSATRQLGSPRTPFTRRQILAAFGAAGFQTALPPQTHAQSDEAGPNTLAGVYLQPFVDPLPKPPVLKATTASASAQQYKIHLSEFRQKLHRDLPLTDVWGFEGSMPGPSIVAEQGRRIHVEWINNLPVHHRLTIDHTIAGAGVNVPDVRSVIHLHGGHVAANSDGYPDDWVVSGERQTTLYPNRQPGATLWYHDHSMGITRLNAMMGLAGSYILQDAAEQKLRLPSDSFDIPLILQDRILDPHGRFVYPVGPLTHTPWVPEFFGTHVLVNGRVSPYLVVEPRCYRFRFLNASNSRIYNLSLVPQQSFLQIGTDGGLLCESVSRSELLIAPGERMDVLLDFRGHEGHRITVVNSAPAPYPSGGGPIPRLIMQFRIVRPPKSYSYSSEIPTKLADTPRLREDSAIRTRRHTFQEVMHPEFSFRQMLLNGKGFHDPITEDPINGTTEIWEFVNPTMDAHPIHLHAVHFQLLDRRRFDLGRLRMSSEVVYTGVPISAPPEERGWKDTILCPPGQVTRIITPFRGEPGRFVWHCHMLEHEDNEMMRPYMLRE
jgi:spore coat protein A, manganese oxidase